MGQSNPFITRWDLSRAAGSGATQLSFGVATSGSVNYTWQQVGGTASGSGMFSGSTLTITDLPTNGIINLSINPTNFQRININNGADTARLTQIRQWGSVAWTSMENAFSGCSNMTLVATDVPNTAAVTNMSAMFRGCRSFNQALPSGFSTANVTNMSAMFQGCIAYNQALPSNFNTVNVTNMNEMFKDCNAFNQALPSGFSTANVTDMGGMFYGCGQYNQILPSNFNTDKVTNMSEMFYGCTAYNQALPSNFNTANVTNMSGMFRGCSNFNRALPSSFNTAKVTDMTNMFANASRFNQSLAALQLNANVTLANFLDNSGMSVANYDATLTAFRNSNVTGRTMGAAGLIYCAAEADRANLTLPTASGGKGWTIIGDSQCSLTIGTSTNPSTCDGTGSITFSSTSFTVGSTQTLSYRRNGLTPALTQNVTIGTNGSFTLTGLTDGVYSNFAIGITTATGSSTITLPASCYFITRWDLSKAAGSGTTQLSFGVATSGSANYTWQQVDGAASGSGTFSGSTLSITGLPASGVIDLSISPTNFQRININNGSDAVRLTEIKQWGNVAWTSMQNAFSGCSNMTLTATDAPNTAAVTDMGSMFANCSNFNQALPSSFNTANVTNMSGMFRGCSAFNQSLAALQLNANVNLANFLDNSGMSVANYDATLTAFRNSDVTGRTMGAVGLIYCAAEADRANLTLPTASGGKGWTIIGDSQCSLTIGTVTIPTTCGGSDGSVAFISKGLTASLPTLNYKKDNVAATPVPVTIAADGTFTLTGLEIGVYSEFTIGITTAMGSIELVRQPLPQISIRSNSPLCDKSGLSLQASVSNAASNAAFSYAWTGPNGFTAATANATINAPLHINAGEYKLQVTNTQTNCSSKDSVEVVVFPLPANPILTASFMQLCKGESVLLTSTYNAATDIFRWTTPPLLSNGVVTLSNINQRIINTPGVYKGICESKEGCLSDEVSINITERSDCNGLNFITVSPSKAAICPNGSVQLTASGCATGTLTWFGGPSPQTGASIMVSPTASTTYLVQCSTGGSGTVDVVVAQPNVQVSNNILTGQDHIKATQTITSDKKIGDTSFTPAPSVLYEAGSSITLLPGFVAEKWSTFKAEIKGCN
jgi:surface protein